MKRGKTFNSNAGFYSNAGLTPCDNNKTGLQPVPRPVEQVHYLGGGGGGCKVPFDAKAAKTNRQDFQK